MITIKALDPSMADIFTDYFEKLSFEHSPHWASCFCRYYHQDCSQEEWQRRDGDMNKAEAKAEIEAGQMGGYMAFEEEKAIGWCNINPVTSFKRLEHVLDPFVADERVAVVICFVIHPEYRGKGLASKLLSAAIEAYRIEEYDSIIALPVVEASDIPREKQYRGRLDMYQKLGFKSVKRGTVEVQKLIL